MKLNSKQETGNWSYLNFFWCNLIFIRAQNAHSLLLYKKRSIALQLSHTRVLQIEFSISPKYFCKKFHKFLRSDGEGGINLIGVITMNTEQGSELRFKRTRFLRLLSDRDANFADRNIIRLGIKVMCKHVARIWMW